MKHTFRTFCSIPRARSNYFYVIFSLYILYLNLRIIFCQGIYVCILTLFFHRSIPYIQSIISCIQVYLIGQVGILFFRDSLFFYLTLLLPFAVTFLQSLKIILGLKCPQSTFNRLLYLPTVFILGCPKITS